MKQPEMPTLDEIAMWLGEKEINLRMAWKKIKELDEENKRLKETNDKNE